MNKEFKFLEIISKTISSEYLGDDCAYLPEYELAISKDCLIEDVHFSCCFMNPFEIAKKALLVNISDIYAAGAIPQYALLGLGGKFDDNFIKEFYSGVKSIENDYKIKIIGGDLFKADKITISITILGSTKNRKISSRKNAKEGYIVAVAGEFGSSARGLAELQEGKKESYFINYHKTPVLYGKISEKIAENTEFPYAMMDSSDGLSDCLFQIAKKSKVKINIGFDKIPKKIDDRNLVLYGGEDYSLVVCLDERDFIKIPHLKKIGDVEFGSGVFVDGKKINYGGFSHFE